MIKFIKFIPIAIALVASPVMAAQEQQATLEQKAEVCEGMAKLGETVMIKKQEDFTLSELLSFIPSKSKTDADIVSRKIIIEAYKKPLWTTPEEYKLEVLIACLKMVGL